MFFDKSAISDKKGGLQDIQFSKNTEDIVNDIYADYDLFNSLSEVQFSRKTEYQNYLKKNRLDLQLLPEPEKNKAAKELVDSIFTWANSDAVPQALKGPYKDLALFYVGKSSIKLPENAIDIVEVYRLSKLYNVNPKHFSDNPQEFITEYSKKATGKTKKVNPDKVKEFYNKVTFDKIGVTIYRVEDSKAGQRAVRAAVDDEWGETANPWCLIARKGEIKWDDAVTVHSEAEALKVKKDFESEGREAKILNSLPNPYEDDSNAAELTLEIVPTNKITKEDDLDVSYKFWNQYNGKDGYGFLIAFQNNKLISFRDGRDMYWWDRFDQDTVELPISLGIDKETGWNKLGKLNSSPKVRRITAEINELENKLNTYGEVDYAEKSTALRKQLLFAKRNKHKELVSWEVTGYQTGSVKKDATHKTYDAQKRLVSEVVRQDGKIIKEVNVERIGNALVDKLLTTTTTELSSYYKDGRLRKSKITIENKRPPTKAPETYFGKYPAIDKVNVTTSEYKYIPIARPYQRVNDDKLVTTEIQSFENSKPKGSMKTVTIVQEPLGFEEPVKQTYYRSVEGSDAKYVKPFDRLQELNEYINESSVLEPSSAMMFSLGLTATGDQDSLLEIQFSKKKRKEYEDVLRKKRPGLIDIPKQVDELFKWADGLVENGIVPENKISKYKKLALHYTANGYTKFPEDGYKIEEVIRLTEKNLLDKDKKKIIINPYAFSNPDELIVKYTEFEKAKKVNPDEVKEFTDKQKLSNGVVVYEVEDSKAGQKAVRGIVDSEWGINANPWCLVARAKTRMAKKGFKTEDDAYEYIREATSKGLTVSKPKLAAEASDWGWNVVVMEPFEFNSETELDNAWSMWERYNEQEEGFKIAFQNGKLISFRDGNEQNWWDRFDQDTELLKISLGIDKDKNSKTAGLKILGGMDDWDGSFKITGYERNSKQIQNGTYEYYDSDKKLTETITYKDSVITKETKMVVDSKGTTTEVFSYDKNGRPLTETYVDISKTEEYKDTPKQTLKEQQETARGGVFPPVGEKIYNIKKYSNKTTHEYIDNRSFGDRDAEVRTTISEETYNGKLQSTTKEIWLKTFIGSGETALPNRWKQVYMEKYVPLDSKANLEIKYRVDIIETKTSLAKKGKTVVVVDKTRELEQFKKFNKQFSKSVDQAAKRNNKMLPKPLRLIGSFTNQDVLDRMKTLDQVPVTDISRDGFKMILYGTYPADGGTEAILKRMSSYDDYNSGIKWTTPGGDRAAPRTKRLAPNGKRSNLNDKQYDLVRTPAFKKWFGDWENDPDNASKVVDENGEPMVTWRSEMLDNNPSLTSKGVFDIKNKTYSGAYFSDNRETAEMWATMFHWSQGNKRPYSLTEAFINIKNPAEYENHSYLVSKRRDALEGEATVGTGRKRVWIPKKNEDGAIVGFVGDNRNEWPWYIMPGPDDYASIDVGKGRQYIVINSNQIKSADGSNKTFDVNEDGIQFSKKKDKPKSDLNIKLDSDFNKILEAKTGVAAGKEFSKVRGEIAGKGKGFFKSIIKPSAEDFVGLLYATLGKGKEGNEQMAWYKANLLDPYARGIRSITTARSVLMQEFKEINEKFKDNVSSKRLREKIPGSDFTVEQAIRVHIWRKANYTARKDEKKTKDIQIPDISESDIREIQTFMKNNPALMSFANMIMTLTKGDGYPKPSKLWHLGSIVTDLLEGLNTTTRAKYLAEWQENVDAIFSVKNLSKLEAVFGANYKNAMVDILYRMKTGRNRKRGANKLENSVMDWINGSVGVIMFFNTKSALLQLLSTFNFINWSDNNILASGKAFANRKQFWKDFMVLWKSEFLLERRNNLKITVNEQELAEAAEKEGFKGAVNLLLQKGFTFTQFGDSLAIASGGAAFYRNRLNSYLKQGMPEVDAEKQAFNDFRELSEESQQSSRADKISQQQSGTLGRLILAFANTPAQYARLIKKAVLDIKNGRGDLRENVSKILYYGVLQNLIFNVLQTAVLFFVFDDDDEEKEKKKNLKIIDVANGMLDSLLRGVGVYGAAISVAKNALLKALKESDKPLPDYTKAVDELFKISPPIASKILKFNQAAYSIRYDADEISSKGFSPSNPAYLAGANVISAAFNVPLDRLIRKIDNVDDAISSETTAAESAMLILGWSEWQLGIQEEQETIERGRRTTGSKKRSSRLKALEKRRR